MARALKRLGDFNASGTAEALERSTNPYPTRGSSSAPAAPATPSAAPKKNTPRGKAALGHRVQLLWREEKPPQWFKGVVKQYNETEGEHLIVYDDGDQRWHLLDAEEAEENLRWEDEAAFEKPSKRARSEAKAAPEPAAAKSKSKDSQAETEVAPGGRGKKAAPAAKAKSKYFQAETQAPSGRAKKPAPAPPAPPAPGSDALPPAWTVEQKVTASGRKYNVYRSADGQRRAQSVAQAWATHAQHERGGSEEAAGGGSGTAPGASGDSGAGGDNDDDEADNAADEDAAAISGLLLPSGGGQGCNKTVQELVKGMLPEEVGDDEDDVEEPEAQIERARNGQCGALASTMRQLGLAPPPELLQLLWRRTRLPDHHVDALAALRAACAPRRHSPCEATLTSGASDALARLLHRLGPDSPAPTPHSERALALLHCVMLSLRGAGIQLVSPTEELLHAAAAAMSAPHGEAAAELLDALGRGDGTALSGLDDALSAAFASLKGVPAQKRFLAAVEGRGFELRWLRQELQQPPADLPTGETMTAAEACGLLRRSHTTVEDKAPLLLLQAQLVRCVLRGTWAAAEGAAIAAACRQLRPACQKHCGADVAAGLAFAEKWLPVSHEAAHPAGAPASPAGEPKKSPKKSPKRQLHEIDKNADQEAHQATPRKSPRASSSQTPRPATEA